MRMSFALWFRFLLLLFSSKEVQASTTAPTDTPTHFPTNTPTNTPTHFPTDTPTTPPTTATPTHLPTHLPTQNPSTSNPTFRPTTTFPTLFPTTGSPVTHSPTSTPTLPTSAPTLSPTLSPTKPTVSPTFSPSTSSPSMMPTYAPTQCPIYCLERDGPVYCPSMHMQCDNGGYFVKTAKCDMSDINVALYVNPTNRYVTDFDMRPIDMCICPSGYRGYSCSVPLPSTCTQQNQLFDGSFGLLDNSPTKKFYCSLTRSGLAASLALIHHRMELTVYSGGNNISFIVHTRRPINQISTPGQYDNVSYEHDWINAQLTNCSVAFTSVANSNAKTVKWTCYANQMKSCESYDDGRNPHECDWFYSETLSVINPKGIASAEFNVVNDSYGIGSGRIYLPFGGINLPLDFQCDTGVCVDDLNYSNITLGENDGGNNIKEVLPAILGGVFGGLAACLVVSYVSYLCWQRKKEKDKNSLLLLDEKENNDSSSSSGNEANVLEEKKQEEEGGIGLVWENISYSIQESVGKSTLTRCLNKKRKTILTQQYGMALPGEVCAILGPSGAGKTSLLNLLADRREQNKEDEGNIFLVGKGVEGIERRDVISYVQQYDSLMSTQTVRESIRFSAMLRIPHASQKVAQIEKKITQILKKLKILHIADSVIGTHEKGGISGGERKRVDIGIELIISPSLLLLDEPTSGLDSNNVEILLDVLRAVACAKEKNNGEEKEKQCAVLLTIHQVNAKMFMCFDRVLILTNHGYTAFFGNPPNAVNHCSKSVGVAGGELFGPLDNPAEVLLQQALHSNGSSKTESESNSSSNTVTAITTNAMAQNWLESDARKELVENIRTHIEKEDRKTPTTTTKDKNNNNIVTLSDRPIRAFPYQFYYLFQRSFRNLARDMSLFLLTLFFSIIIAIFVGFVFYQIDDRIPGLQNRFGLMFFLCIYFCLTSLSSLGKFVGERKVVFEREIMSGYYRVLPYYLSECFTDFFSLRVFPPIIFALILTQLVGLQHTSEKLQLFILILILCNFVSTAMCLMVSAGSGSIGQANYIAVLITIIALIFGGLILSNDSESSLSQIKVVSFIHYAYEALMANELHGKNYFFNPKGYGLDLGLPGDIYLSNYGMSYDNLTPDLWSLVAFFAAFLFVGYLFLLDIYGSFRRLLARRTYKKKQQQQNIRSSGIALSQMKKVEGSEDMETNE